VPAAGGGGGVFGQTVCAGCGSAQMPAAEHVMKHTVIVTDEATGAEIVL